MRDGKVGRGEGRGEGNCQRLTVNGQWLMEKSEGRGELVNGQRSTVNGQWANEGETYFQSSGRVRGGGLAAIRQGCAARRKATSMPAAISVPVTPVSHMAPKPPPR